MPQRNFGRAWAALALALALHVADEAANDFLSVYNPAAAAIRDRFPFLPLPVFTFPVWLGGLIAAVVILLALSPLACRGARWLRALSVPYGALMLLNGLGHTASSVYYGRLMPGVYSAPVLLAASGYLLYCGSVLRSATISRAATRAFSTAPASKEIAPTRGWPPPP
jgi:hypothetical protein